MDLDTLYDAAIAGDADAIAKLEMRADILDVNKYTILHIESREGNIERVRFILRQFAHKNLLAKLTKYKHTALHLALYEGRTEVAEILIDAARHLPVTSFQAFLRQGDKDMDTALHAAVMKGHASIVKLLVEADPSDTHIQNYAGKTPIYIAVEKGHNDIVEIISTTCTAPSLDGPDSSTVVRIKNLDQAKCPGGTLYKIMDKGALYEAAIAGDADAISILEMKADKLDAYDQTILHIESKEGDTEHVRFILREFAHKNLLVKLDRQKWTALSWAAYFGQTEVAEILIDAARHLPPSSASDNTHDNPVTSFQAFLRLGEKDMDSARPSSSSSDNDNDNDNPVTPFQAFLRQCDEELNTALHLAVLNGKVDIVKLLVEADPSDTHIQNDEGKTPMYIAAERGYIHIVKVICTTCTAPSLDGPGVSTALHAVIKNLDKARKEDRGDVIRLIIEAVKRANNHLDVHEKERRLIELFNRTDEKRCIILDLAVEGNYLDVIELIFAENPAYQSSAYEIYGYEEMVSTPFHVAAEKGYTSTVKLLLELWPSSSSAYTAVDRNGQNILHLAALQSKKEMIQCILKKCPEEYKNEFVNWQDSDGNTPLHLLIRGGCFVPELLRYEGLDIWAENKERWTPPNMLYFEDKIIDDQVQIKIALDGMQIDPRRDIFSSSVLTISKRERKDVILKERAKLMIHEKHARMKEGPHAIANCFADAIAGDPISKAALEMEAEIPNQEGKTILHVESMRGETEHVRFIVREFAKKNILVKLDTLKQTALHLAAHHGHTQVVKVLIEAASCNLTSSSSANDYPVGCFHAFIRQATSQKQNTALHIAVNKGNVAIVKLLVEADPSDRHIPNDEGKTPIYLAAEKGYNEIIEVICTTCTALCLDGPGGSTTALHAAIQNIHHAKEEDREVIRKMIDAAKRWSSAEDAPNVSFEALFNKTDMSGHTALELAVDRNYVDTVELILLENPAYQHGRGSKNGLMRLIYKAIDKEYTDIVKLLSQTYEAGITTSHKGVVALILAINRRDEDSVIRLLGESNHIVTFADDEGWTPLHYAAYNEFVSILDVIIKALMDVKYPFVYGDKVSTPFHVAAECKYTLTVIQLMKSWPASSSAYTAINKNGQNILHLAAANNKKEMIQGILKYCPEKFKDKILEQQDANGDTPLHLLISNGCFIPELIKHKGLDTMAKNKKKWTPRDMLYFQEDIIADQVEIKIALDDVQNNQSWKFWRKSMEKKTDIFQSLVRPSRRETKDVLFDEQKKILMDAKHGRMKKDLERYKKRTNTQIIVTALITTVTFTVGFTMPGGLHQSGEVNEGLVVLTKKEAFKAFMVSDALALLLSTCSLFLYFLESMYEDPHQVKKLNAASVGLNIVSVIAMMLTFITGTYLVLSHSPSLAITVCLIGSFFFIFVIVLLIKLVYDRQVKRNED